MIFHDIKITSDENSMVKHVFIDGVEQYGVLSCDVRLRKDEIPTVTLEYVAMSLTMDMPGATVDTNATSNNSFLNLGIEHLEISCRAYNVIKIGNWDTYLNRDKNDTIADVVIAYRNGHLKKYAGMGKKTYNEIITQLKKFDLIGEDEK